MEHQSHADSLRPNIHVFRLYYIIISKGKPRNYFKGPNWLSAVLHRCRRSSSKLWIRIRSDALLSELPGVCEAGGGVLWYRVASQLQNIPGQLCHGRSHHWWSGREHYWWMHRDICQHSWSSSIQGRSWTLLLTRRRLQQWSLWRSLGLGWHNCSTGSLEM